MSERMLTVVRCSRMLALGFDATVAAKGCRMSSGRESSMVTGNRERIQRNAEAATTRRGPEPSRGHHAVPRSSRFSLQDRLGNEGVLRFLRARAGMPLVGDPAEREAVAVSERLADPANLAGIVSGAVSYDVSPAPAPTEWVPPDGSGRLPPSPARSMWEAALGADFERVSIHSDQAAAESARALEARAFALGSDISLGPGWTSDASGNRRVMLHELVHVVQQGAVPRRTRLGPKLVYETSPPGRLQFQAIPDAAPAVPDTAALTNSSAELAAFRVAYLKHFLAWIAARDALDVGTLALLAALLEQDALTLKMIGEGSSQESAVGTLPHEIDAAQAEFRSVLGVLVSPQMFRDEPVLGGCVNPAEGQDPVAYLHAEIPRLLATVHVTRQIVELAAEGSYLVASLLIGEDLARPVDRAFQIRALEKLGVWDKIVDSSFFAGGFLDQARSLAEEGRSTFGAFAPIGSFDLGAARSALTYGVVDWAVTDEDAMSVFRMLATAEPAGRDAILVQLASEDLLGRLAENLPWGAVRALHDGSTNPRVRQLLYPYFEEYVIHGPGESLAAMYDRLGMQAGAEGRNAEAFGWAFLHTAHQALTLGFLDTYSEAYDLQQRGLISSDALWSTGGKALLRSAAVFSAMILTGGAGGGLGSGLARGIGMSARAVRTVGGMTTGLAGGLGGEFAMDVYNQSFFGQEGFSPAESYLAAAGIGLFLGGVAEVGGQLFPKSAVSTASLYGARFPWLARLVGLSQAAGTWLAGGARVVLYHGTSRLAAVSVREGIQVGLATGPGRSQWGRGFYLGGEREIGEFYAGQKAEPEILEFPAVDIERLGTVLDVTTGPGRAAWDAFLDSELLPGFPRRTAWVRQAEVRGQFLDEFLHQHGWEPDVLVAPHGDTAFQVVVRTTLAASRLQAFLVGALQPSWPALIPLPAPTTERAETQQP